MDVCPVGAITTRDYRFKSRPWDNPNVVDTMCTLCSKGCSTSAWLKAKPEWAKGQRLIRLTPRFNPEVNGYWMCDIGRFNYHWIEGESRLPASRCCAPEAFPAGDKRRDKQPTGRASGGTLEAAAWHDVEPRLRDGLQAAGSADPEGVRFLGSAHASTEELFVLKQIVQGLVGADGLKSVSVTWTRTDKNQPGGDDIQGNVPGGAMPTTSTARATSGSAVGAAATKGCPTSRISEPPSRADAVKAAVCDRDPGP